MTHCVLTAKIIRIPEAKKFLEDQRRARKMIMAGEN